MDYNLILDEIWADSTDASNDFTAQLYSTLVHVTGCNFTLEDLTFSELAIGSENLPEEGAELMPPAAYMPQQQHFSEEKLSDLDNSDKLEIETGILPNRPKDESSVQHEPATVTPRKEQLKASNKNRTVEHPKDASNPKKRYYHEYELNELQNNPELLKTVKKAKSCKNFREKKKLEEECPKCLPQLLPKFKNDMQRFRMFKQLVKELTTSLAKSNKCKDDKVE